MSVDTYVLHMFLLCNYYKYQLVLSRYLAYNNYAHVMWLLITIYYVYLPTVNYIIGSYIHCKTILCEIRRDTALYNSVINSVYTVDELCIQTSSDTKFVYCVDGVYDKVIQCCIFPYFT